jgi:hypothetical protein
VPCLKSRDSQRFVPRPESKPKVKSRRQKRVGTNSSLRPDDLDNRQGDNRLGGLNNRCVSVSFSWT